MLYQGIRYIDRSPYNNYWISGIFVRRTSYEAIVWIFSEFLNYWLLIMIFVWSLWKMITLFFLGISVTKFFKIFLSIMYKTQKKQKKFFVFVLHFYSSFADCVLMANYHTFWIINTISIYLFHFFNIKPLKTVFLRFYHRN